MIKLTLANSLFISDFMNSSINYINTYGILLSQLSPIIPLISERYQVDNNKEDDDEDDDPIAQAKEVNSINL